MAWEPRGNGDQFYSNFLAWSNVLVDTKARGVGDNNSALGQVGVQNPRFAAVANTELVPGFALSSTPMAEAHYQWLQDQTVRNDSHPRLLSGRGATFTPLALADTQPLLTHFGGYRSRHSLLAGKMRAR